MNVAPPRSRLPRIVLLLAAACAAAGAARAQRPAEAHLTRADALARADRIGEIAYRLELELDADAAEYSGRVETTFELADAGDDLTVDFVGGSVAEVELNGTTVDAPYNGYYLTLPAARLERGENTLEIAFSHPYSTDGAGLYRMRDPEDDRVYVYTDFQPYDQNRLFPSFDQPDLKATFASEITAPADWTVVSVTQEASVREQGGRRVWTFPESDPISTYIFALHAGDYRVWTASAGDIPLRLLARRSLAEHVEAERWFDLTRRGFEYFEQYFGIDYPFGKYDQLIVPHFNAGAMENLGAVTFSERFIRRGAYTRENRRAIANVLMHEMAHMWFGNLVTMDWWNGIWLNEAFATFMANRALVEATRFKEARESAYRSTVRAYRADERDTTHPIEMPVPDTDAAFANFDAITYYKGSAVLAQLNRLVGPDAFREGVSRYLAEHAHASTGLADFLDAVAEASGRDLDAWAEDWLETPGANTVEVELECADGRIDTLRLRQSAPDAYPVLRTHRTQIGLYDFVDGSVDVRTVPVTFSGELTNVEPPADDACPDLAYANHGDWDYARVRLDPGQLPALAGRIAAFDDALTRSMLWQGAYDLVLDARLPVPRYVELALANAAAERDDAVLDQVLASLESALDYLIRLDADAHVAALGPRLERFLWRQMRTSDPGSDRQLMLFDRFVASVTTEPGLDQLAALFADDVALPEGLELDQDRRWNALETLSAHGHARAAALIQAEAVRDDSDLGRQRALTARAAAPGESAKRAQLDELFALDAETSLAEARAIADGLFPVEQHALLGELTPRILEGLEQLSAERASQYLEDVAEGLVQPLCRPAHVRHLDAALERTAWMPPTIEKTLRDSRFEAARCLEIGASLSGTD